MKVLFVNGSPKGRYSVTLQTCLYLEKRFPEHDFEHLNVGAGISVFERSMRAAAEAFASAELIIFAYPVYSFLVPSQLHRFIELLKSSGISLNGKYAAQLTTSGHLFDFTAHRFMEENCRDMGMKVIRGLSADTEDLLSEQGRKEAEDFFRYAVFCVENALGEAGEISAPAELPPYEAGISPSKKSDGFNIAIIGDLRADDENLRAMIKDFDAACKYRTRFVNLADFPFKGGCLGCLSCALSGSCVYRDGFDAFIRDSIQSADAVVYAFNLRDHSMGSRFKMFDDRQFSFGLRGIPEGRPYAYICRGDMSREENLRTVLEARAQFSHGFLAGIACDKSALEDTAARLCYALEQGYVPAQSFYAVGGRKISRDRIWVSRGLMKEEHRFYSSHGLYDFPQKKWLKMLGRKLYFALMRSPSIRRRMGRRLNDGMLRPYRRVIDRLGG